MKMNVLYIFFIILISNLSFISCDNCFWDYCESCVYYNGDCTKCKSGYYINSVGACSKNASKFFPIYIIIIIVFIVLIVILTIVLRCCFLKRRSNRILVNTAYVSNNNYPNNYVNYNGYNNYYPEFNNLNFARDNNNMNNNFPNNNMIYNNNNNYSNNNLDNNLKIAQNINNNNLSPDQAINVKSKSNIIDKQINANTNKQN